MSRAPAPRAARAARARSQVGLRVDARPGRHHADADDDAQAGLQRAQLFEFLALLEARRRQRRDALAAHRRGRRRCRRGAARHRSATGSPGPRRAVARPRDRCAAEIQRRAVVGHDDLDDVRIEELLQRLDRRRQRRDRRGRIALEQRGHLVDQRAAAGTVRRPARSRRSSHRPSRAARATAATRSVPDGRPGSVITAIRLVRPRGSRTAPRNALVVRRDEHLVGAACRWPARRRAGSSAGRRCRAAACPATASTRNAPE